MGKCQICGKGTKFNFPLCKDYLTQRAILAHCIILPCLYCEDQKELGRFTLEWFQMVGVYF